MALLRPVSDRLDVVELAKALVGEASVSGPGAERPCAGLLERVLRQGGLSCALHVAGDDRANLIAVADGAAPGPSLLLTGHLDVVAAGSEEQWDTPPFTATRNQDDLVGRGTADMKGAVAAMTVAAVRSRWRGLVRRGRLVLAFTADEEGTGKWGIPWLLDAGLLDVDLAIVGEPSGYRSDFDTVALATRGFAACVIDIATVSGHSSFYRPSDPHAVAVACRLQQTLERSFVPSPARHWAYPDGPTVVAGAFISGGVHYGVLPPSARLHVDARLLPGATRDGFFSELDAFARSVVPPNVGLNVSFDGPEWGPPACLDREAELAIAAVGAVQEAGHLEVALGGLAGFSEGAFLAAAGIPTIPALGPGLLRDAHLPNERVSVGALVRAVDVYSRVIERTLG